MKKSDIEIIVRAQLAKALDTIKKLTGIVVSEAEFERMVNRTLNTVIGKIEELEWILGQELSESDIKEQIRDTIVDILTTPEG